MDITKRVGRETAEHAFKEKMALLISEKVWPRLPERRPQVSGLTDAVPQMGPPTHQVHP